MFIKKEITKNHTYCFEYPFSYATLGFCRQFKEEHGYQAFGFYEKKWRFNNVRLALKIQEKYPDIVISDEVKKDLRTYTLRAELEKERAAEAERIKNAADSDIEVKNIKRPLYPYQKLGVEFFINNNGKAILADTMGLGKTAQALAYVAHENKNRTLVVCPASVKYAWENEVRKWTKLEPFVITSKTTQIPDDGFDVFIINYDILKKFYKKLVALRWDCIIFDEFHYIKSQKAQRTGYAKIIAKHIDCVLMLSGTPMLSRPVELFTGLNMMDPEIWHSWFAFTKRYCNGHQGRWGWEYRGASNIDELKERIGQYFLRRTKDEVLTELPPKNFIDIPVEMENGSRRKYDLALTSFQDYLKKVKKKDQKEIRKSMQAMKLVRLNELRQITSQSKIDSAKEIIQSVIDNGEKVVVFSTYNEPLEELYGVFEKNSVLLTGSTKETDRREIIDDFQDDPNIHVFFGGIKSAGVGITLTSASNVLFIDYSWVPADHAQAVDRIHRIGQDADSINVYQLYTRNTIDEYMKELLNEKQQMFDKLIENKEFEAQKDSSLVNDLLLILDKK